MLVGVGSATALLDDNATLALLMQDCGLTCLLHGFCDWLVISRQPDKDKAQMCCYNDE